MVGEPRTEQIAAFSSVQPSTAVGWANYERRFKVFISYSRRDSATYALRLVQALETRGLAAKLDMRDLEFGERWQKQLREFIRQADAVVFVVSPMSIESKWCRWEVAQVASQSKRLVPVVHIPVPDDRIPAEIKDIQFFQLRPGIDFSSNTQYDTLASSLANGLQKDKGWLQEHTRLTDVALEWQANHRQKDVLLRGSTLSAAERWLTNRPPTAPPPNTIQLQFISASQTFAKQRARRWTFGLAAIAIGGLTLAGLAYWQREVAINNALEVTQRNFDLRKSLGTTAAVLSRDPQHEIEALRIAVQATAPEKSHSDRVPPEAFAGLTAALSRISLVQPLNSTFVTAPGSGGQLVTIDEKKVALWTSGAGGPLSPSSFPLQTELLSTMKSDFSFGLRPKVYVSIGGHFASVTARTRFDIISALVDLDTGKTSTTFHKKMSSISNEYPLPAISLNGQMLAVVESSSSRNHAVTKYLSGESSESYDTIIFNTVSLISTSTNQTTMAIKLYGRAYITALSFSKDAKKLAVGDSNGAVSVFSSADGSLLARLPGPRSRAAIFQHSVTQLEFDEGDHNVRIWIAEEGGSVRAFEIEPSVVPSPAISMQGTSFSICPGSNRIITAFEETVRLVKLDSGGRTTNFTDPINGRLYSQRIDGTLVRCSPNGKWLEGVRGDLVRIWDAQTGLLLKERRFEGVTHVDDLRFLQTDELKLLIFGGKSETAYDATAYVWSLNTTGLVDTWWGDTRALPIALECPKGICQPQAVKDTPSSNDIVLAKVGPDKQTAFIATLYGGHFIFKDGAVKKMLPTFAYEGYGSDGDALEFTGDSRKLLWYSASDDHPKSLSLYDVDTGTVVEEIPGRAYVAAVSPLGDRFAVVFYDSRKDPKTSMFEISIIESGKVIQTRTQVGWIGSLVFLKKDRLASGGVDGKVRIWDLTAPSAEPAVLDHDGPIDSITWACSRLYSSDGNVHEFDIEKSQHRLIGPGGYPVVSPGCSRIAAIDNNSVVVWDLQTGLEMGRFLVHDEKKLRYVEFLNDETILSLGDDGFVKVYSLDLEKWRTDAEHFLADQSTVDMAGH